MVWMHMSLSLNNLKLPNALYQNLSVELPAEDTITYTCVTDSQLETEQSMHYGGLSEYGGQTDMRKS